MGWWSDLWSGIKNVGSNIWSGIKSGVNFLGEKIKPVSDAVAKYASYIPVVGGGLSNIASGVSSVIDYAISVNKPFVISDSYMFRNIYSDSICVYYTEIKRAINNSNELFGFDKNNRFSLCVPFLRKDTPVIGARFSSLLLAVILTFIIYIKK